MAEPLVPSNVTLKKYGMSVEDWLQLYYSQGEVCAVCKKLPTSGRLNIDHEHVKGWNKLPPEQRRKWVRGLVCFVCNHRILTRGTNYKKLLSAAEYLFKTEILKSYPFNKNTSPI